MGVNKGRTFVVKRGAFERMPYRMVLLGSSTFDSTDVSNTTAVYAIGAAYLIAHSIVYTCAARFNAWLMRERGVFRYHFFSALLFSLAAFAYAFADGSETAAANAFGLVAVHAIYSMSFLELWSLTQGSYSVQVLQAVRAAGTKSKSEAIRELADIGETKRHQRLDGIVGLRLVRRERDLYCLTPRGSVSAAVVRALLYTANYKRPG